MSFDTDQEIEDWIGTNGMEAFRRNTENGVFSGRRRANALAHLRRIDADNANARDERLVKAAEDSAQAAKDQADTARKALKVSKWAIGIAIAAMLATLAQWLFPGA